MGEVYLAEDPRLHRKVALKILPADLAANQDRMRRFNQEATAAAALNHPSIAHIYEIGESDGKEKTEGPASTLGQDAATRVPSGSLSTRASSAEYIVNEFN